MARYNHWFWNSSFMNWVAQRSADLSTWIWHMQYKIRK